MYEDTIGILLSNEEWKKLYYNRNIEGSTVQQYHLAANNNQLDVIFFTIQGVYLEEEKVHAFAIKDNRIINKGKMPIPAYIYNTSKFNRRKNIKTLRDLSQNPNIHVINEHHSIKDKFLYELVSSHQELGIQVNHQIKTEVYPFFVFNLVGQRSLNHGWEIPVLYAKGIDGKSYTFEEAYQALFPKQTQMKEVRSSIYEAGKKLLDLIQFYYPGLYETGIQFHISNEGEIYIYSIIPIKRIIRDISQWNEEYSKTVAFSLKLLKDMKAENVDSLQPMDQQPKDQKVKSISEYKKYESYPNREANIWGKITSFEDEQFIVKLPAGMLKIAKEIKSILQFGVKEVVCSVEVRTQTPILMNNSYDFPSDIMISTALLEKMHIPTQLTYQFKISPMRIQIGPTVGFLLGERNQIYNPTYMRKYSDRLGEYKKFGGLVAAFSPRSIDWENNIAYGMIYQPDKKQWIYHPTPIPSTIYRRNFHQHPSSIKKLIKLTGNKLFNSYHYKKSDLFLLKEEPLIRQHLPETFLLQSVEELEKLVQAQKKVILKPVHLSRGRGIFILEGNEDGGYTLFDYRQRYKVPHKLTNSEELKAMLIELNVFNNQYLFQTYIPLLTVNSRVFDVRVVMQKYDSKKWQCTGIECRVAGLNEELTNISRGGKAMTLEQVIEQSNSNLSYSEVYKDILNVCESFCHKIDQGKEHFAEFGLDIALDEEGYPWILEANIFPSFKGFKKMDYDMYLKIRYQPLTYAVRLQGFKYVNIDIFDKDNLYTGYFK